MYYIYSLKCKDGYYVGCTDNIQERLDRHQKGKVPATMSRIPITLEFYFAVEDKYRAFEFEKYLKTGSGCAFINKHLIEN
ncbi:MAG: GIY-YIG nuclease family protein [Candidatus Paceibacterota bacterium]